MVPKNTPIIISKITKVVSPISDTLSDYITLTKPPIIVLLLITAVGGMFAGSDGGVSWSIAIPLLIGGATASGGASAINHYMDRDIDAIMTRTRRRPLPDMRIGKVQALMFGVFLNVVAFVVLTIFVNTLSAVLALSGTVFYVLVYTLWLKRTTPQNIVIGGAAGSIPPVVGWAAVTGSIGLPALYLFGIVFLWTPAHFWALSLLIKEDYALAGIPMLPVVKGENATKRGILMYSVATVAMSLILFFATDILGILYLSFCIILGAVLILLSWKLITCENSDVSPNTIQWARRLYLYSLLYLALIFLAVIIDRIIMSQNG